MHLHNKLKVVALSAAVAACLPLSAPVLAAAPEPAPVLLSAPATAPVPVAEPIYKILPAVNDPNQAVPTPAPAPGTEPIYKILPAVNDQGKVIDSSAPTTAPVKPAPAPAPVPAPADGAVDGSGPVMVPIYKQLPTVPAQVYVDAKAVTFDQAPVVQNEELMLPLRAMVEAAGGQVEWSQADHSVHVMVNGYAATFTIGQTEAEIRKVGVFYIRQPIVTLTAAPVIEHDRTLVPASVMDQLGITWADHQ